MKRSQTTAFEVFEKTCGGNTGERATDWLASWVHPISGHVYLAGESTRLAVHDGAATNPTCTFTDVALGIGVAEHSFTGIMGVGDPLTLFIVSESGRVYSWQPPAAPAVLDNADGHYRGVYVLSPDLLIAVGTVVEATPWTPGIYAHSSADWDEPTQHTLSGTSGYNGSLRAIGMESESEGYAVGDDGLVLRKDGAAASWTRMAAPAGVTPDFTSVVVHPISKAAYIVDKEAPGQLRRLTAYGWSVAPSVTTGSGDPTNVDKPLHDIAMTPTGEFWLVGDEGRVYHYPEP